MPLRFGYGFGPTGVAFVAPPPPVQVMIAGDSIALGATSTDGGGWRREFSYYIANNGLGIDLVGSKAPVGTMPDGEHCCVSGASLATIATNVLADLGTGGRTGVRLLIFEGGTNDLVNGGVTGAVGVSNYSTRLNQVYAALIALQPSARIVAPNITPIQSGTTGDTEWANYNAALPAVLDAFDAAHPSNTLLRVNQAAAPMDSWSGTYFANTLHPNDLGHHTVLAGQYLSTAIRTHLRSIAPSINALACTITSPASGASLVVGVPVTITVTFTRSARDVVVTVKDGATTLGTATLNEYTSTGTYSWTPLAGDIGAHTINVTIDDVIDSSSANAVGIPVTVAAATYNLSSFPGARLWIDMKDPASYVVNGTPSVTSLTNKISGIVATEATAPPNYEATGGPGGNTPCITGVAASSHKMVGSGESSFSAFDGDDTSESGIMVVKLTSTNATGFIVTIATTAANIALFVGQVTTSKYWVGRSTGTSADNRLVTTVSGWAILEWRFDGPSKLMYVRINGGTELSGTVDVAANATTFSKWGLFCRADNAPDTFSSASIAEVGWGAALATAAEMTDAYNYLNTKWGLGLTPR